MLFWRHKEQIYLLQVRLNSVVTKQAKYHLFMASLQTGRTIQWSGSFNNGLKWEVSVGARKQKADAAALECWMKIIIWRTMHDTHLELLSYWFTSGPLCIPACPTRGLLWLGTYKHFKNIYATLGIQWNCVAFILNSDPFVLLLYGSTCVIHKWWVNVNSDQCCQSGYLQVEKSW